MATEDERKVFVGGLSGQTTKETLHEYCSKFGEIDMCTIKTDVYTGRSRGFGFIVFKDLDSMNQMLATLQHEVDGKNIEAKKATPQAQTNGSAPPPSTKVFVGGLDKSTKKEDIEMAFSTRGKVVDVYLPKDNMTQELKGFAFVNFDDSSLAATLCAEGKIIIGGKECDIKKANNKNENRGGGFRTRGFARGGGRGGYQQNRGFNDYNGGYGGGYNGGYGGSGYGGYGGQSYDQYGGDYGGHGGYTPHASGYGTASGYGGGYDANGGYVGSDGYQGGWELQVHYKIKGGNRGGGNGREYQPH